MHSEQSSSSGRKRLSGLLTAPLLDGIHTIRFSFYLGEFDADAFFTPPGKSRRRTCGSWSQCAGSVWINHRKLSALHCDISAYRHACARNWARTRHPSAYRPEHSRLTPALLLARDLIICWVRVSLVPVELTFGLIEAELQRRGLDLGIDA